MKSTLFMAFDISSQISYQSLLRHFPRLSYLRWLKAPHFIRLLIRTSRRCLGERGKIEERKSCYFSPCSSLLYSHHSRVMNFCGDLKSPNFFSPSLLLCVFFYHTSNRLRPGCILLCHFLWTHIRFVCLEGEKRTMRWGWGRSERGWRRGKMRFITLYIKSWCMKMIGGV